MADADAVIGAVADAVVDAVVGVGSAILNQFLRYWVFR